MSDPKKLSALFKPRSVALVGATERSIWSNAAFGNLERFGYGGAIYLINRKGGMLYGRQALTSLAEIEGEVDVALLMVPEAALEDTIEEMVGKVRSAVILSSGFAETGEAGRQRQAAISEKARRSGITLLGPNCLGFINYADKIPVWTTMRRRQRSAGALAVVSQSGAIANNIAEFGYRQGIPFSFLVSTGNEADVDVAAVLEYFAEEPSTRSIAVFLETVRDGERFAAAALRVRENGKAIVLLKVGASEVSAKAAQAHTGSLVGDDRVFDAACRRYGMIRVSSLEDLVFTADLLARLSDIKGTGVGMAAISGGMCEIAADRFEAEGLPLPELSLDTLNALKTVLPAFGTPHNPLDLTGGAMLDVSIFETALGVAGRDRAFDVNVCLFDAPEGEKDHPSILAALEAIGAGLAASGKPGVVFSNLATSVTAAGRAAEEKARLVYSGAGLDRGVTALCRVIEWRRRSRAPGKGSPAVEFAPSSARPRREREVLDYLAARGVPVISAELASSAGQAAEAARRVGAAVVLKIMSPDIAHKSDVGGVGLRILPEHAAQEYQAMMLRVQSAAPAARIEGVIVSPMREIGLELLVGTVRDPQWGPAITVGFGGVLVEVLNDFALRLLPVTLEDVREMLGELRGAKLFSGFRGSEPVDLDAVAAAVKAIGDAALALGPKLASLEVNPLLASGSRVEALDGLAIWEDE